MIMTWLPSQVSGGREQRSA